MSDKKGSPAPFPGLFREESEELLGFFNNTEVETPLTLEPASPPVGKPLVMPVAQAASQDELKAYWRKLRAFFRTGEGADEKPMPAFPALLAHERGRLSQGRPFPIWLADAATLEKESGFPALAPIQELLARAISSFAKEDGQARILKDNLPRLLGLIMQKIKGVDEPFKAFPVLDEALDALLAGLSVKGEEGAALAQDAAQLKRALPKTGLLIPFSSFTPLHLLANYLHGRLTPQRRRIMEEINQFQARLKTLLEVEREKRPGARSAEQLQSGMDFAQAFLNFEELSAVLPESGAELMPEARLERIGQIVAALDQAGAILFETDATLLVSYGLAGPHGPDWERCFPGSVVRKAEKGQSCAAATALFDRRMEEAARIFGALRMARLEYENLYAPEIHGDFFAHFGWRQFSDEEMAACPPVILLADAAELLASEMDGYSGLLASGRPMRILLLRQEEHRGEAASNGLALPFRPEPGALAIAHRKVFFYQGAALRTEHFFQGMQDAFSAFTPAVLHLLMADVEEGGQLWMSAAVEGREFSAFTYDSRLGPKWGSRFDIRDNPQPEMDWPQHELAYVDAEGKQASLALSFTFADFAAQHPEYEHYFQLVPAPFWSENLIPLVEYLALPPEQSYSKAPFIWVVDDQNQLQKAAPAWPVVLACRERLDFWRFLQENAGIHSYHVELATEKLRRELESAAEARFSALEEAHRQELEKTREETARQAMAQLADVLLGLEPLAGLEALAPAPAVSPPAPAEGPMAEAPPVPAAPAPEPVAGPEKAEEPLPLGEAWIETPQCTSCNECTSINNRIFKYNADEQAYVADPKGGPFADIVRAAESCPARIIHPGAPQNPAEPGLEALIKRAEPFN